MRNSVRSILLIIIALPPAAAIGQVQPVVEERTWYFSQRHAPPPTTISERLQTADLVVRGTIESHAVDADITSNPKAPKITTTYTFVVSEVIKGPLATLPLGARIRVLREGGEVKHKGQIFRVVNQGLPDLEAGEYLLFLNVLPGREAYQVLWASDGVFDLRKGG